MQYNWGYPAMEPAGYLDQMSVPYGIGTDYQGTGLLDQLGGSPGMGIGQSTSSNPSNPGLDPDSDVTSVKAMGRQNAIQDAAKDAAIKAAVKGAVSQDPSAVASQVPAFTSDVLGISTDANQTARNTASLLSTLAAVGTSVFGPVAAPVTMFSKMALQPALSWGLDALGYGYPNMGYGAVGPSVRSSPTVTSPVGVVPGTAPAGIGPAANSGVGSVAGPSGGVGSVGPTGDASPPGRGGGGAPGTGSAAGAPGGGQGATGPGGPASGGAW